LVRQHHSEWRVLGQDTGREICSGGEVGGVAAGDGCSLSVAAYLMMNY